MGRQGRKLPQASDGNAQNAPSPSFSSSRTVRKPKCVVAPSAPGAAGAGGGGVGAAPLDNVRCGAAAAAAAATRAGSRSDGNNSGAALVRRVAASIVWVNGLTRICQKSLDDESVASTQDNVFKADRHDARHLRSTSVLPTPSSDAAIETCACAGGVWRGEANLQLAVIDVLVPPKDPGIADRPPSAPDYAKAVPTLEDPYATAVSRAVGMPCRLVPTILPHQVNFPALLDLLQSGPDVHAASRDAPAEDAGAWFGKNAAEAFAAALMRAKKVASFPPSFNTSRHILDTWRRLPSFAVGAATARPLAPLGVSVHGTDAGKAEALADVIAKHFAAATTDDADAQSPPRRLLILCGDRRLGVLPARLKAAGLSVYELVVYKTRANPRFESDLATALADYAAPAAVVFFSPSGADVALPVLRCHSWWPVCRVAAIGPTTAARLTELGCSVAATAEKPRPEAAAAACTIALSASLYSLSPPVYN
ncbi:hypothetical protein HK405_009216 [Cladochytrium tenue]|nr:hypothetical protein HK405_009216 [Cladochytrium tenue]